jgi:hypothetical protein
MNWKPHKDKIEFTVCLGHTDSTPENFCHKSDQCLRNTILRHSQPSADTVIKNRCCITYNYELFEQA